MMNISWTKYFTLSTKAKGAEIKAHLSVLFPTFFFNFLVEQRAHLKQSSRQIGCRLTERSIFAPVRFDRWLPRLEELIFVFFVCFALFCFLFRFFFVTSWREKMALYHPKSSLFFAYLFRLFACQFSCVTVSWQQSLLISSNLRARFVKFVQS